MSIFSSIQVVSTIIASIAAICSIYISLRTLKQNATMIENSTRPYVVIYSTMVNFSSPVIYVVLKNFGASSAYITHFECMNFDLKELAYDSNRIPFDGICNSHLSPGQKYLFALQPHKLQITPEEGIIFKLSYSSSGKNYTEEYCIKTSINHNIASSRASFTENELRTISYTLQEFVERNL